MERHDRQEIYCRSLGDFIYFSYCRVAGGFRRTDSDDLRSEATKLPCSKILDCWITRLPVLEYLKEFYRPEELRQLFSSAPGRLERILNLARQAQSNGVETEARL